ncbi:MAG: hypothetical protein WCJ37_14420 [Syntrophus sp. (in: bacteria)]
MEAFRVVETPVNRTLTIRLPGTFGDGPVEVIILPTADEIKTGKSFNPHDFFGITKLDMTEAEIDKECRKVREEWNRGF